METGLFLVKKKSDNNDIKRSYAIITWQKLNNSILHGQVIFLEGERVAESIEFHETLFETDKVEQRIESKLTRELASDITIEIVNSPLKEFLKEKFETLIPKIIKVTIDIEIKKAFGK